MKLFRDEAGQTLVLTALLMCILMGFMALAIDMGVTFRAQRRIQTQADAAAIAAALCGTYGGNFCKAYSGATDVTSVAQAAAQSNGMPSSTPVGATACTSSPCMQIHQGASYGQHTSGYYEAIILAPSANIFMSTFSGLFNSGSTNFGSMTVGARAVAGSIPGQNCANVLNKTAHDALAVQGSANIDAEHCSIQVDSAAPDAVCTTGGATITSQQILVVGQQGGSGNCNQTQNNVETGGGGAGDPLAGMVHPDTGCSAGNTFGWGGTQTDTLAVNPSGQLVLTNPTTSATQVVSGASFTPVSGGASTSVACFQDKVAASGTIGTTTNEAWVFQNGLNIAGSGLMTFNGTVEIQGGNFQEQNANLFINGPVGQSTSQPYTGMALLVYSTAVTCSNSVNSMGTIPSGDGCLQVQFGSGGSNPCAGNPSSCSTCTTSTNDPGIVGTIYAPHDVLYLQDNGGCVSATNLIADLLWVKASDLTITNYNLVYTTSPLNVVRLVE